MIAKYFLFFIYACDICRLKISQILFCCINLYIIFISLEKYKVNINFKFH